MSDDIEVVTLEEQPALVIEAKITPDKFGDILYQPLPGGQAATALHMGEYHAVGAAWSKLSAWVEANGHGSVFGTFGGWDVYENDPDSVSDASELRTRIYQPLPK